ncbi:deoxyribonuclease-2-alpha [Electrophorus electricus]|uniref:Deoxyribonuclease-2-alpha n=1 Tax=Electrophorus electricus TaxID=8005 RepID=A0A4W4GXQ3_ELEEL|nr:deoxyribonuclease-2-alpha [Electrophorus electricus]
MFLFVLLLLVQPAESSNSSISCYDDQGNAVDWFYLYKLPRLHEEPPEQGLRYLLLGEQNEQWVDGSVLVGDSTGALGRTVSPLYEKGELGYILYNDQPPEQHSVDNEGRRGGHTKGIVLFDSSQGYWLVHSTPHFAPRKAEGRFSYPSSGIPNGQNFICVTYPLKRFETIGQQLKINQPHVYDCDVPETLATSVPTMLQLCKESKWGRGNYSTSPASYSSANQSVSLLSLAGQEFISFAKGASFKDDLYHSWVAPTLQSDLLVQFWHRSTGVLSSDCSPSWTVLNVHFISPGGQITFKTTEDHSKWAVSAAGGGPGGWVCVGDINRNEAEENRGGGTVCHLNAVVWKAYRTAVLQCDLCTGGVGECDTSLYH